MSNERELQQVRHSFTVAHDKLAARRPDYKPLNGKEAVCSRLHRSSPESPAAGEPQTPFLPQQTSYIM